MSKSWAGGSTRRWRKVRQWILVRDRYVCQIRLPNCTGKATQVHHTLGKKQTGDDPAYLVAACKHCNLAIGDPTKRADPPNQAVTRW